MDFKLGNLLTGLPYEDNEFDVVNMRMLVVALRVGTVVCDSFLMSSLRSGPKLSQKSFELLKPEAGFN